MTEGMNFEKTINETLNHLVARFNAYSELVALNAYKGHCDDTYQWNRGQEYAYEEEAKNLANKLGRKINYEMRDSTYYEGEPNEFVIEYRAMFLTF